MGRNAFQRPRAEALKLLARRDGHLQERGLEALAPDGGLDAVASTNARPVLKMPGPEARRVQEPDADQVLPVVQRAAQRRGRRRSSSASPRAPPSKEGALGDLAKALGPSLAKAVKREEFTGQEGPDRSTSPPSGTDLKPRQGAPRRARQARGRSPTPTCASSPPRARASRSAPRRPRSPSSCPAASPGAERATAEGVVLGAYRFTKYLTGDRVPKARARARHARRRRARSRKEREGGDGARPAGRRGRLHRARPHQRAAERALPRGARRRAPSRCARSAGSRSRSSTSAALEKKGMKLILAVGQGSAHEPRFVHMTYKPAGHARRRSSSSSARASRSTPAASASSPPPAWTR